MTGYEHVERLLAVWGKLPTTAVNCTVAAVMALATTTRYVLSHPHVEAGVTLPKWEPSYEWLGFVLLYAGVAATQFFAKRATDATYVAAKQGQPPTP